MVTNLRQEIAKKFIKTRRFYNYNVIEMSDIVCVLPDTYLSMEEANEYYSISEYQAALRLVYKHVRENIPDSHSYEECPDCQEYQKVNRNYTMSSCKLCSRPLFPCTQCLLTDCDMCFFIGNN